MPQRNAIKAVKHGRARVLARREQVCVVNLTQRWMWSVLGFGNDGSRGRDPSRDDDAWPLCLNLRIRLLFERLLLR